MHMANELLSPSVALGGFAISISAIAHASRKLRDKLNTELIPLMGVLGAFVFAAQMINFTLPAIAGTSDHLIGTALLAILLGPYAAIIVISGVLVIQCLIFQDGGLLALGVNIINMGIIPSYISYIIWQAMTKKSTTLTKSTLIPAVFLASFIAVISGAIAVCIEVAISRVLTIPIIKFSAVMIGLHAISGAIEGTITSIVLLFLYKLYPQLSSIALDLQNKKTNLKPAAIAIFVCAIIIGGFISLFASQWPDGLEKATEPKTYSQLAKTNIISPSANPIAEKANQIQHKIALLPDYDKPKTSKTIELRKKLSHTSANSSNPKDNTNLKGNTKDNTSESPAQSASVDINIWTSISGILGTTVTLILIWIIGKFITRKQQNYETSNRTIAKTNDIHQQSNSIKQF